MKYDQFKQLKILKAIVSLLQDITLVNSYIKVNYSIDDFKLIIDYSDPDTKQTIVISIYDIHYSYINSKYFKNHSIEYYKIKLMNNYDNTRILYIKELLHYINNTIIQFKIKDTDTWD